MDIPLYQLNTSDISWLANISDWSQLCWNMNEYVYRELVRENQKFSSEMLPTKIFYVLLIASGVIGSTIVITVYSLKLQKPSTAILFIFTLALVDLFVCTVVIPYSLYELFKQWTYPNAISCKIFEWFRHSALCVSCLTCGYIAVDRYFAICRPLTFALHEKRAKTMICSSVVLAFLLNIPALELYGFKTTLVNRNKLLVGCACFIQDKYYQHTFHKVYRCLLFALYCVVTTFMITMYIYVYLAARNRFVSPIQSNESNCATKRQASGSQNSTFSRRPQLTIPKDGSFQRKISSESQISQHDNRRISISSTITTLRPDSTFLSRDGRRHRNSIATTPNLQPVSRPRLGTDVSVFQNGQTMTSKHIKTAKMLFMVTAFFIITWLPFWVMTLGLLVDEEAFTPTTVLQKNAFAIIRHFYFVNNVANPVIYAFVNPQFRKDVICILCSIKRKLTNCCCNSYPRKKKIQPK